MNWNAHSAVRSMSARINDADLGFRYNVTRGLPVLVHDAEGYYRFLERTWNEHFDFLPVAELYGGSLSPRNLVRRIDPVRIRALLGNIGDAHGDGIVQVRVQR